MGKAVVRLHHRLEEILGIKEDEVECVWISEKSIIIDVKDKRYALASQRVGEVLRVVDWIPRYWILETEYGVWDILLHTL